MGYQINRVRCVTATTGTGSSVVVGAAYTDDFFTPVEAGAVDGVRYSYIIQQGTDVEIQQDQVWTASGTTIARGTPVYSRISGVAGTTKLTLSGSAVITFGASAADLMFLQTHGADIASASTVNLDTSTGATVNITGTSAITAITLSDGQMRFVRFTGALTLTASSSLVLPSGANITTAANDFAQFIAIGSNVYCVNYFRASWKVASAFNANTVTTAAQPNITSVGTLTSLTTSGQITSTLATGTAPFVVTSTTQVANLSVATAGSATTAGTVTTAAQPNITSVGTLTSLSTSGQITSTLASGTAPFVVTSTTQVANLNVATAGVAGTVTTAAQPNITSVGTLATLTVTAAIAGSVTGSAATVTTAAQPNITSVGTLTSLTTSGQITSTLATGTAPFVVTSTTQVANLSVATAGSATTAGTVTTAAQPNITSVGTLSGLTVSAAIAGSVTGTSATVTTAAQPNITSVGTLTGLTVSGTITATNTATQILAPSGVTTSNWNTSFQGTTVSGLMYGADTNGATNAPNTGWWFHTNMRHANGSSYWGRQDAWGWEDNPNEHYTRNVSNGTFGSWVRTLNSSNYNSYAPTLTGTGASGTWSIAAATVTTAAQPNITSVGTLTALTVSNSILPSANITYNLGSTSARWVTAYAQATTALYADLAEKYVADEEYEPGTVVSFDGSEELTISRIDLDTKIAGVISTQPGYIMNDGLEGNNVVMLALTGRVPVKVQGRIAKGDMLVSAGNGRARAESNPVLGSVIGKALQHFDGATGVIEVVVGRL
jgi:hypothetical protein